MTSNHITSLHIRSVPVLDQDEALDFYTTHLGFAVRDDVDLGFMRWLTVGVPGQDTSLLQEPVEQPYGTDFGIRDPFGNHVRINQPAVA